jgi:uncharacterized protein YndB with AHSA1/START domain/dihydrofolate reductase
MPNASESESSRELVIQRFIDAPARILFEAYSKPEYIRQWFGPVGWPVTLCEMDFRKGGRFRFAMTGPDGKQNTPFGGQYLEIVPNQKIVYDNAFEVPGAEKMVVTVTFREERGGTQLTIHTLFASVAMYREHVGGGFEQGTNSGLDQLAELAARQARTASERPIVVSTFVTLDGYMVGPDEDVSWVIAGFDRRMQADIAEHMSQDCDSFVFGRVTYEIFAGYWPKAVPYEPGEELNPAGGREDPRIIRALNDCSKLVISTTLPQATWKNTRLIREGLEQALIAMKRESGKAISVQGSASVVQALARTNLVDEYRLYLHPVLLGAGKQLFAPGASRQDFARADVRAYDNGVTRFIYRRR